MNSNYGFGTLTTNLYSYFTHILYQNTQPNMILSFTYICKTKVRERGGSVVERWTHEPEVGVRNLPLQCCVLEQDTLLPESTGNTQEAMALSRHD